MYGCTVAEASRFGRFLACTLNLIKKWKDSEEAFRKQGKDKNGHWTHFIKLTVAWEVDISKVGTFHIW